MVWKQGSTGRETPGGVSEMRGRSIMYTSEIKEEYSSQQILPLIKSEKLWPERSYTKDRAVDWRSKLKRDISQECFSINKPPRSAMKTKREGRRKRPKLCSDPCCCLFGKPCNAPSRKPCNVPSRKPYKVLHRNPCNVLPRNPCNVLLRNPCNVLLRNPCNALLRSPCNALPRTPCNALPRKPCNVLPRKPCHVLPKKPCHVLPRKPCNVLPRKPCHVLPRKPCHVPRRIPCTPCKKSLTENYEVLVKGLQNQKDHDRILNTLIQEITKLLTPKVTPGLLRDVRLKIAKDCRRSPRKVEKFVRPDRSRDKVTKRKTAYEKYPVAIRNCLMQKLTLKLGKILMNYMSGTLSGERTKTEIEISKTILGFLSNITGETLTPEEPQTTVQGVVMFLVDRVAGWLSGIACDSSEGKVVRGFGKGRSWFRKPLSQEKSFHHGTDQFTTHRHYGERSPSTSSEGSDTKSSFKESDQSSTRSRRTAGRGWGSRRESPLSLHSARSKSNISGNEVTTGTTGNDYGIAASSTPDNQSKSTDLSKPDSKLVTSKGELKYPSGGPSTQVPPYTAPGTAGPSRKKPCSSKKDTSKADTSDLEQRIEEMLEPVLKWIRETVPVISERQENLNIAVRQRLETVLEQSGTDLTDPSTKAAIEMISSKVATWIDKLIENAEIEAKRLGAAIHAKEENDKYLVKKVGLREVEDKVALARAASRANFIKELGSKPDNLNAITLTEVKAWGEWAAGVTVVADEWAKWIDKTVTTAERQSKGEQRYTEEEWKKYREQLKKDAIDWRKSKKMLKETAALWDKKAKKYLEENN